jgi:8-oxo-dGTP pyrophosphatase MutT (NUDIX family)
VEAALRRALAGRSPPADLAAAALARLPPGTATTFFARPLVPAAVLVGLRPGPEGLAVILTRRTEQLRDHPGQISFPGGRIDPGDRDPVATALREAGEEVALPPTAVEVIGCLPAQPVVTGFAVCPVVGFVAPGVALVPEAGEVAEVFEVPLGALADPACRSFLDRPGPSLRLRTLVFDHGPYRIWGATAHILADLLEILDESES